MRKTNAGRAIVGIVAMLAVLLALAVGAAAEGTAGVDVRSDASINVQNGSFEKGQTWTDGYYKQPDQAAVPSWNTSAFEGKIELFRENFGIYIPGVTLKPADENYAAELNADEESTLYQVLNTQPSSIYEWSLSHGARTTADTMALIIGPNQSVPDPTESQGFRCLLSKPNKGGRDQFMQMIDWLDKQGELNGTYTNGLYNSGKPITLYSKRFAENGAFKDNAGNNPFSLTPSPFYTQKWQIWLMQDQKATSGTNPWRTYGTSAANNGGNANSGLGEAYYRYTVPTGQRQTLFGFVSFSIGENMGKTFGNFLDDITFTIYHPLTASTTPHGSAIIISTLDNKQVGQYEVKPDQDVDTYVQHGVALNLEVKYPEADVTFAGVYYKTSDGERVFIPNRGSESDNPWKKDDTNGRFTYTTAPVETGVELYFVFIKSPMITYDPNGGDAYDCGQTGSNEAPNVYSFKPNEGQRVPPYTAHAATKTTNGQKDEDWRFTGWRLSDDNNTVGTDNKPLIIPGVHTVACNYDFKASSKQQPFVIIGENESFDTSTTDEHGTLWGAPSGVTPLYDTRAMGLTLVAQWKWRQTFVPCVKQADGQYAVSPDGGTVTINKEVTEVAETHGISYFAEEQETITVTATAKSGYTFEGWYDKNGELKAIEPELTYEVGKGDVRKYYARFAGNVVQTYIRQIPDENGNWIEVPVEKNVAALDHTQYAVGPGTVVTSTPGADTEDYIFVGWYDSSFNKVADSFILSDKRTLSYQVTGDATYYARFVPRVKFEVRYVDGNGNVTSPPVTGEDYGEVSPTEAAELPGTTITSTASPKQGFRFVGWYDSTDANRTCIGSDATYTGEMPPVGTTYYAMFTAGNNSGYRVQHIKVKQDGTTEVASEARISSVPTGTAVSAQDIDIPGYTYRTDLFTVNGTPYQSNPSGAVRGDGQLVLKLYYTPTNQTTYRIEYYKLDAQGNETLADAENRVAETDAVVSVTGHEDKFQAAGYSFAAYYGKNRLTGVVTVDPMLVLKVYYEQQKHTVRFNMHGFGAQVPPQTVPHNGTATRPEEPVELGYVFGGWYTDDQYTALYDFSTPVTADIELHAKWNMIWPVNFDMQGHGEPVDRQLVEDQHYAERPNPEPKADGYVFKGWYKEAACQNEFVFANEAITGATTVYARWTANVTVTKEWEGGSAAEVQVRLLKDGQGYDTMPDTDPDSTGQSTAQTCEQTLNEGNSWTHTWTNLPADSVYTVEEVDMPGDCTAVYERVSANSWKVTNVRDKQMAVTVTNKHRSDTIGMVIRKQWDDAGNRNRPGSVRVRIVNAKTNAVVQESELNAANNWTWNVAGLPKRQDGGETVRYLVQEVGEYAGYSAACEIVVEADGSYTVKLTNVLTGKLDIEGEKRWDDNGDRDGLRPDSVQLKIYQNAIAEQNLVRIVSVTAEAGSGIDDPWSWSVQDLPVYDEFGRPITYIVVEDPVPAGYTDPGPRRITVNPS